MSTSQRSFDQVKSILGKLDRDIDAARARRLQSRPSAGLVTASGTPEAVTPTPPSHPPTHTPAPMTSRQTQNPDAVAPASPVVPPARSPFGRAQPLRPEDRARGLKP